MTSQLLIHVVEKTGVPRKITRLSPVPPARFEGILFDPFHIDECMCFFSEIDKKHVFLRFGLDERYEH